MATVGRMSDTTRLIGLRRPAIVIAFSGWNDAGDAATGVIDALAELTDADVVSTVEPEEFYDMTVNRPLLVRQPDGNRTIEWPTTEILVGSLPDRDLVLVNGPEPHMHWGAFTERLLATFRQVEPVQVIVLGAMLADTPHSRPVPISEDGTDYEGPTGITGVVAAACLASGLPTSSLWASVPHYVSDAPSPKVTLALLGRVEDLLDATLDPGDLPQEAQVWEGHVNELVGDDPDITEYVRGLESRHDEAGEAGEEIALEFERYLRRRAR